MINLIPETYTAPASARRRYVLRSLAMVAALLVVFVLFFGLTAARPDLAWLNLAMVVICAIFMAAATYEFVALMRSLDELQQRVHVTSLAIGFGAAVMITMLWAFASALLAIPRADPVFTFVLAILGYYIALFFTGRRFS
jgi:Kef-type K+ transport system membrane component KefB